MASVAITAWQYTVGIGVELMPDDRAAVALYQFGLLPGDIVQKVDGATVRTPRQLV